MLGKGVVPVDVLPNPLDWKSHELTIRPSFDKFQNALLYCAFAHFPGRLNSFYMDAQVLKKARVQLQNVYIHIQMHQCMHKYIYIASF